MADGIAITPTMPILKKIRACETNSRNERWMNATFSGLSELRCFDEVRLGTAEPKVSALMFH